MIKEKLTQSDNLDEVKEIALNLFDEVRILQEQMKSLQDKLFGRKSEKTVRDDGQVSLFSNTPQGAHASAAIYSLIEIAKASGHDPYWYLKYLFELLPEAMTSEEFESLLPYNVDKSMLASPTTD